MLTLAPISGKTACEMKTNQPNWKFITNLDDCNPLDHGGLFVYEDTTGVYAPEMELLQPLSEDPEEWEVRRAILEPCTFTNGILSDNKFHPDKPAWFADKLESLASTMGTTVEQMIEDFTSDNAIARANAWRCVGDYFGWDNLDSYPLRFSDRAELEERYAEEIAEKC